MALCLHQPENSVSAAKCPSPFDTPAAELAPDLMAHRSQVPEELLSLVCADPLTDTAHTPC